MRKTLAIAAFATGTAMFAGTPASAQEMPTVEQTYRDIEATFGTVPTHFKAYPKSAVAGAWAMTKGLEIKGDNALEPRVKALINLAVAAQIPCRYCTWFETRMARNHGASEEEIAEAVAQAAYVRHWSTVLNGLQVNFETFKTEFGGE
ncbi:alkylhydroperoxidase [Paramesorhizobium deserti]|uniref:Alkylhydroperoxidase n=1 Tax=Paramesorhizobium deserti TaxID=1494590 RepID=A0A135HNX0_9HYPH|nr:carboxymuconolactone decarboxylase family protein [Paramesorhizobium deserti]KXF74907.1 alkylhydroperoxidase [Paramesorhizobium deserti]